MIRLIISKSKLFVSKIRWRICNLKFCCEFTVNSEVQIKTSSVESDVESVVSDVENWLSYSLRSDNAVVVVCLCFSDKDSKSETRMSSQSSYQ